MFFTPLENFSFYSIQVEKPENEILGKVYFDFLCFALSFYSLNYNFDYFVDSCSTRIILNKYIMSIKTNLDLIKALLIKNKM